MVRPSRHSPEVRERAVQMVVTALAVRHQREAGYY